MSSCFCWLYNCILMCSDILLSSNFAGETSWLMGVSLPLSMWQSLSIKARNTRQRQIHYIGMCLACLGAFGTSTVQTERSLIDGRIFQQCNPLLLLCSWSRKRCLPWEWVCELYIFAWGSIGCLLHDVDPVMMDLVLKACKGCHPSEPTALEPNGLAPNPARLSEVFLLTPTPVYINPDRSCRETWLGSIG